MGADSWDGCWGIGLRGGYLVSSVVIAVLGEEDLESVLMWLHGLKQMNKFKK